MPTLGPMDIGGAIADPSAHVQTFDVGGLSLQMAAPALTRAGEPPTFRAPRPWGQDEAVWSGA